MPYPGRRSLAQQITDIDWMIASIFLTVGFVFVAGAIAIAIVIWHANDPLTYGTTRVVDKTILPPHDPNDSNEIARFVVLFSSGVSVADPDIYARAVVGEPFCFGAPGLGRGSATGHAGPCTPEESAGKESDR